ncbi:hypothetical protein BJ166DRAFT_71144 [Pestalotiopsis sp. NC0098]|nr:hypothetical protein BJ166DRAFT_71144 [Pestalotiopsis sp. NC0098]
MDWLIQKTKWLPRDLNLFRFSQPESFRIKTVTLSAHDDKVEFQTVDFHTENEYSSWIAQCRSSLQDHSTFLLVIHERHDDMSDNIPYSKALFEESLSQLYQHRSLAWSLRRTSTAIFNSKNVEWECDESIEQSLVYNCRSDTTTLGFRQDIALSTTYFQQKPWTFSVIYGCPERLSRDLVHRLNQFKRSAFHPLMMPMIFAEHERSRFLQIMEVKGSRMQEMILNLQNMAIDGRDGVRRGNVTTRRDYEAGYLWDDLSRLKIGMESLKKMLGVLDRQFDTFGELELRPGIKDFFLDVLLPLDSR